MATLTRKLTWRTLNFTGGLPLVKQLNAVYQFAGGCQIPGGELFNVVAIGEETLYDFVHRQKQVFQIVYYGFDPAQLAGIELSWYEGITSGFRDVKSVSDYAGLSALKAPPAGLSLGLAIIEAGLGTSYTEALSQPGVDTWTAGFSVEFGAGIPGPGLEEGASGVYLALVAAMPLGRVINLTGLAALENEIRRSSSVFEQVAIEAARFWWTIGSE